MKKLILFIAAVTALALSSCYKHTTCATYLDNTEVQSSELVND